MRANSMGVSTTTTASTPRNTHTSTLDIETSSPIALNCMQKNYSLLCCAITTLLLSAGAGVGIWYAVTELY